MRTAAAPVSVSGSHTGWDLVNERRLIDRGTSPHDLVAAHDDPGVGTANELTAIEKIGPSPYRAGIGVATVRQVLAGC
jgi:hypothetical protein